MHRSYARWGRAFRRQAAISDAERRLAVKYLMTYAANSKAQPCAPTARGTRKLRNWGWFSAAGGVPHLRSQTLREAIQNPWRVTGHDLAMRDDDPVQVGNAGPALELAAQGWLVFDFA